MVHNIPALIPTCVIRSLVKVCLIVLMIFICYSLCNFVLLRFYQSFAFLTTDYAKIRFEGFAFFIPPSARSMFSFKHAIITDQSINLAFDTDSKIETFTTDYHSYKFFPLQWTYYKIWQMYCTLVENEPKHLLECCCQNWYYKRYKYSLVICI